MTYVLQRQVVACTGISAGGKTTFAKALCERLARAGLVFPLLELDNAYKDLRAAGYTEIQRAALETNPDLNWDHPDIMDPDRVATWLEHIKQGTAFEIEPYCFATHSYQDRGGNLLNPIRVDPTYGALVEGHLLFKLDVVRQNATRMLYVTSPSEVTAMRRIERDVRHRGRTLYSVLNQLEATVIPMQRRYIMPCAELDGVETINWYVGSETGVNDMMGIVHESVNPTEHPELAVVHYIAEQVSHDEGGHDEDQFARVLAELKEPLHTPDQVPEMIRQLHDIVDTYAARIYHRITGKIIPPPQEQLKSITDLFEQAA